MDAGRSGWQVSLPGWPAAQSAQLELERVLEGLDLMAPESSLCSVIFLCWALTGSIQRGWSQLQGWRCLGKGKEQTKPLRRVCLHTPVVCDFSHSHLPSGVRNGGDEHPHSLLQQPSGSCYCHDELGWVKPKRVRTLVFWVSWRTCLGDVSSLIPSLTSLAGFPLCSCVLCPDPCWCFPIPCPSPLSLPSAMLQAVAPVPGSGGRHAGAASNSLWETGGSWRELVCILACFLS